MTLLRSSGGEHLPTAGLRKPSTPPPALTLTLFLGRRLYNNIVVPSLIAPNSNYYLFKEGIKPAWEDSANAKGGKWSVQLPRGKFSAEIDQYWLFTVSPNPQFLRHA